MNVWVAVCLVGGWLLLSVVVGMAIGAVVRRRERQRPRLSRVPRGNVDETTAVRAVLRDR